MSARRWLAFVSLWLCALCVSAPARAAEIDRFRVVVRRSATSPDAIDVTMELEYRAPIREYKRDGFKFVGRTMPRDVRAQTRDGRRLRVTVGMESNSGEYRLDFSLSDAIELPGAEERRHVIVQFTQELDEREHWSQYSATLDWTAKFRVPVRGTVFEVEDFDPRNAACVREGPRSICRVGEPEALRLSRPRPNAALPLVSLLVGLLTAAGILAKVLRDRHEHRVLTRGVVPPAPAPAYVPPSNDPKVYRAPMPLPKPQELAAPQLPEVEQRRWRQDVRDTLLLALGPIAVALFAISVAGSSVPVAAAILISCVVATIAALFWDKDDRPIVWPALGASLWVLGPIAAGGSGVIVATVGLSFVAGIGVAIKNAPAGGGGSSGGSSSCSSSSCGGGGGGCGGGGGGGGCGG